MSNDRFQELRWIGVPDEIKLAFRPHVQKCLWILPSWVEIVHIEFVTGLDGGICLRIQCSEEYRSVRLNITPTWLAQDESVRERDVQHEFLHACVNPLHQFGLQLIEATVTKGSALEVWAQEQLRLAVEKATCDLENMLQRSPGSSERRRIPSPNTGEPMRNAKLKTIPQAGYRKSGTKGASKPSGGAPRKTPQPKKVVKGARVSK